MTGQERGPLDPAAIMAAHEAHRLTCTAAWSATWPTLQCEPYRLAAELAAMRERLAEVVATLDRVNPARSSSIMLTAVYRAAGVSPHREARAALAGEPTAEQPQPEHTASLVSKPCVHKSRSDCLPTCICWCHVSRDL